MFVTNSVNQDYNYYLLYKHNQFAIPATEGVSFISLSLFTNKKSNLVFEFSAIVIM